MSGVEAGHTGEFKWPHSPELQLQAASRVRHKAYVGQLLVQRTQPAVQLGFICGSLPVPTINPSSTPLSPTRAALVPAINLLSQRAAAPRYRLLPTETDLNMPPLHGIQSEEFLPVTATHDAGGLCNTWEGGYLMQPLARKCETLAVSALTGYGDEIDVVAPVDILKQIFKTPYCKARLSVAVHRIGQTLILNSGPDNEEGEKIARRKKNQAKAMERNLFSKFVQHSVHYEASDSSDSPQTPETGVPSSNMRQTGYVPRGFGSMDSGPVPWQVVEEPSSESAGCCSEDDVGTTPPVATRKGKERGSLSRRNRCGGGIEFQKAKFLREQQQNGKFVPKDPEKPPRSSSAEGFLRVLFWQFQNLRMLLGSDLLLFSNEKHAAVSLHLMDIGRQVTPLMWLDAWLDNVMASIPELAVCYHRNGVVQGYELLKTDDIFLLKGLSEDGSAFFHPHVVQQNASSVLRFLQENCKQDPGTYWLFKNAGEDLMQLFDLSVISKTCNTCEDKEDKNGTLPSSRNRDNGHYSLPLAMLLYRLANRLSHSQDPSNRLKCATLFRKCLEFMDEQEHLVIRASAHEHAARLILSCYKQLGVMLQPLLLESSDTDTSMKLDIKSPALELPSMQSMPVVQDDPVSGPLICDFGAEKGPNVLPSIQECQEVSTPISVDASVDQSITSFLCPSELVLATASCRQSSSYSQDYGEVGITVSETQTDLAVSDCAPRVIRALADPVSARLAAVHHISQAIKSLRWQRQLQDVGERNIRPENVEIRENLSMQQAECICGENDCVAICDFRDIEVGFGMDQKLWQLLLLLGESYLTLGQAYKEAGQLGRALKAAELSCLVRGSTPRLEIETTIASPATAKDEVGVWHKSGGENALQVSTGRGLFWVQVWVLAGDVFAEIQRSLGDTDSSIQQEASHGEELKMAQEVMKEVKRLKKKVGEFRVSCEFCSLSSCSCQNDRASSGNSASSSSSPSAAGTAAKYNRKHAKKIIVKNHFPATPDISTDQRTSADKATKKYSPHTEVQEKVIQPDSKAVSTVFNNTLKEKDLEVRDIFSYLRRPMINDWEGNLSAAFECYSSAVNAFADSIHMAEYDSALRKKGWACNELGRRRLAQGNVKSAEEAFEMAIGAFRAVKDLPNIVLVYCNLAHGRRAAAEVFASQLSAWEDCQLPQFYYAYSKTVSEARLLYQEALEYYGEGRRELLGWGESVERSIRGLWNEVHTQLAHTYLKLGMLLAREEKFTNAHKKAKEEQRAVDDGGNEIVEGKQLGVSAKEAISKALVLYESLGTLRAQEAAYSQFQLACHQRDCCLLAMAMKADDSIFEKGASMKRAKRSASMAERYWLKSMEYYRAETHADMFLQILMERSAMCLSVARSSHPNLMWEQALSHLLEGHRAMSKNYEHDSKKRLCQPSPNIITKFTLQLQKLLKTMLGAAISATKPNGGVQTKSYKSDECGSRSEMHIVPSKASDIGKLKVMYRIALAPQQEPDLGALYNIWTS